MFPKHWSLTRIILHAFCEMLTNQKLIRNNQEKLMSELDDVKTQLSTASSKLSKLSSDVDAFIAANSGGATDADLQGISASLEGLNSTIDAIEAKVAPPTA